MLRFERVVEWKEKQIVEASKRVVIVSYAGSCYALKVSYVKMISIILREGNMKLHEFY